MKLLTAAEFEMECRVYCDSMYERPSSDTNPVKRLVDGKLDRKDALNYWSRLWQPVMVFNQTLLPRLLERCGDIDARVDLWGMVHAEFGRGIIQTSRPWLFRSFLTSLGANASEFNFEVGASLSGELSQLQQKWDRCSLVTLLATCLGRESVAPKTFAVVAESFQKHLKLQSSDLQYFSVRYQEGKVTTEALFKLLARYADTVEKQQEARSELKAFFERETYRNYACNVCDPHYSFANPTESRKARRVELRTPVLLEANGKRFETYTKKLSANGLLLQATGYDLITHSQVMVHLMDVSSDKTLSLAGIVIRVFDDLESGQSMAAIEFDAARTLQMSIDEFSGALVNEHETKKVQKYGT